MKKILVLISITFFSTNNLKTAHLENLPHNRKPEYSQLSSIKRIKKNLKKFVEICSRSSIFKIDRSDPLSYFSNFLTDIQNGKVAFDIYFLEMILKESGSTKKYFEESLKSIDEKDELEDAAQLIALINYITADITKLINLKKININIHELPEVEEIIDEVLLLIRHIVRYMIFNDIVISSNFDLIFSQSTNFKGKRNIMQNYVAEIKKILHKARKEDEVRGVLDKIDYKLNILDLCIEAENLEFDEL